MNIRVLICLSEDSFPNYLVCLSFFLMAKAKSTHVSLGCATDMNRCDVLTKNYLLFSFHHCFSFCRALHAFHVHVFLFLFSFFLFFTRVLSNGDKGTLLRSVNSIGRLGQCIWTRTYYLERFDSFLLIIKSDIQTTVRNINKIRSYLYHAELLDVNQ